METSTSIYRRIVPASKEQEVWSSALTKSTEDVLKPAVDFANVERICTLALPAEPAAVGRALVLRMGSAPGKPVCFSVLVRPAMRCSISNHTGLPLASTVFLVIKSFLSFGLK